jgi:hypothetical protein
MWCEVRGHALTLSDGVEPREEGPHAMIVLLVANGRRIQPGRKRGGARGRCSRRRACDEHQRSPSQTQSPDCRRSRYGHPAAVRHGSWDENKKKQNGGHQRPAGGDEMSGRSSRQLKTDGFKAARARGAPGLAGRRGHGSEAKGRGSECRQWRSRRLPPRPCGLDAGCTSREDTRTVSAVRKECARCEIEALNRFRFRRTRGGHGAERTNAAANFRAEHISRILRDSFFIHTELILTFAPSRGSGARLQASRV